MNVGTGHWVFAAVFAIGFVLALYKAYGADKLKSPSYFSGSSSILLTVLLVVIILIVVKILNRLG